MRLPPGGQALTRAGRRPAAGILWLAAALFATPTAADPPPAAPETPPLRLLAPDRGPGTVRVDTLVTDPAIDRVVFFLGGRRTGADGVPPYSVRVEVPEGAEPMELRAVAFDRKGRALGEDSLHLGAANRLAGVALRPVAGDPAAGWIDVEVAVTVPAGERLDGVALYRNRELVGRTREARSRHRVATPAPAPEDYLRAVATLTDGTVLEDARLLSAPGPGERLEVNLLELVAVATGRDGAPVRGLAPGDFRVLLDGRELAIERFREARQVPLTLALLVDSSTSMRPIMEETREAAGRFLERTLAPGDRALLVDVDTQPRLAHGLTGDPAALAAAFERLEADGDTALYDSLAYAAAELLDLPGRRALVALTDGEDSSSHLDLRRCLALARRAGLPVYVLSVGGLREHTTRPDRSLRLGAFARETGGRLYAVTGTGELDRAYDEIEAELRSQYLLGVATDGPLAADELAAVEVRVPGRRLRVRATARGN